MSEAARQAQLLSDGFLDDLGTTKSARNPLPVVAEMLASFARSFAELAAVNLDKVGAVATGDLSSQIIFSIDQSTDNYILNVGYAAGSEASKYYDFVNKGVKGAQQDFYYTNSPYKFKSLTVSKSMAQSLLKWLELTGKQGSGESQKRNLSAIQKKRSGLQAVAAKPKNLLAIAYGMSVNIKKFGLRKTAYFDDAIAGTFETIFFEKLRQALGQDVKYIIRTA